MSHSQQQSTDKSTLPSLHLPPQSLPPSQFSSSTQSQSQPQTQRQSSSHQYQPLATNTTATNTHTTGKKGTTTDKEKEKKKESLYESLTSLLKDHVCHILYDKEHRRFFLLRLFVLTCLLVTAISIGYGSFLILSKLQTQAQEEQYYALARKIESSTILSVHSKKDALLLTAKTALYFCPNVTMWPNCAIPFEMFDSMASPLHRISLMRSISTASLIQPSTSSVSVADYENFVHDFYVNQYPSAYKSIGVYTVNATTGKRYHDTTGLPQKGGTSKYQILTPVFQIGDLPNNAAAVMFNLHGERRRAKAIDYALDCVTYLEEMHEVLYGQAKEASHTPLLHQGVSANCTSMTEVVFLVQDVPNTRPASLTLYPILAYDDRNVTSNSTSSSTSSSGWKTVPPEVVGFVSAVHNWDTILSISTNDQVTGIIAVLSNGLEEHSFIYSDGVVSYLGKGDYHDSEYDSQRYSFEATTTTASSSLLSSSPALSASSLTYHVTLYPTKEWLDIYEDSIPAITCGVAVGLVIFTSLVFSLYDYLINRNVNEKELILQTKRQFVRYISHEIRTPLNVVLMGFQLLCTEMMNFPHEEELEKLQEKERELKELMMLMSTNSSDSSASSSFDDAEEREEGDGEERKEGDREVGGVEGGGLVSMSIDEHGEGEGVGEGSCSELDDSLHNNTQTLIKRKNNKSNSKSNKDSSKKKSKSTSSRNKKKKPTPIGIIEPPVISMMKTSLLTQQQTIYSNQFNNWLELIQDIVESADAAITVLNDLMSYDKLDNGTMVIQRELLPIWSLISTTIHPFTVQAKSKGIELELVLQGLWTEEMELQQQHERELLEGKTMIAGVPGATGVTGGDHSGGTGGEGHTMTSSTVDEVSNRLRALLHPSSATGPSRNHSYFWNTQSKSHSQSNNTHATMNTNSISLSTTQMTQQHSISMIAPTTPSRSHRTVFSSSDVDLELGSNSPPSNTLSPRHEGEQHPEHEHDDGHDHDHQQNNVPIFDPFEGENEIITEHQLVLGDKPKLCQVIRNLVSNALKFTPPGGKVSICCYWKPYGLQESFDQLVTDVVMNPDATGHGGSTGATTSGGAPGAGGATIGSDGLVIDKVEMLEKYIGCGSLVLSVTDTGAGMSNENLHRLFGEGVQFNANKLQGGQGSGLGLWISKGIVELHRGKLFAYSAGEGYGSTFTLELPVLLSRQQHRSRGEGTNDHLNEHDDIGVTTGSSGKTFGLVRRIPSFTQKVVPMPMELVSSSEQEAAKVALNQTEEDRDSDIGELGDGFIQEIPTHYFEDNSSVEVDVDPLSPSHSMSQSHHSLLELQDVYDTHSPSTSMYDSSSAATTGANAASGVAAGSAANGAHHGSHHSLHASTSSSSARKPRVGLPPGPNRSTSTGMSTGMNNALNMNLKINTAASTSSTSSASAFPSTFPNASSPHHRSLHSHHGHHHHHHQNNHNVSQTSIQSTTSSNASSIPAMLPSPSSPTTPSHASHSSHHHHGSSSLVPMTPKSRATKCGSIDLLVAFPSHLMSRFTHVLIVDDSPINRKMISRSLQSLGFMCEQANDGVQCVEMMMKLVERQQQVAERRERGDLEAGGVVEGGDGEGVGVGLEGVGQVDLILMDYEMPRLSGPLAVERLRALGIDTPVVGITGNVLKEDTEFFLQCGANKVIHKPFTVQVLEKALQEMM